MTRIQITENGVYSRSSYKSIKRYLLMVLARSEYTSLLTLVTDARKQDETLKYVDAQLFIVALLELEKESLVHIEVD